MPDDTIIIKAPAGTKSSWVRQSQRAGMKLSDWLIERVEAQPMKKLVAIVIPADVPFSELNPGAKHGNLAFPLTRGRWSVERPPANSGVRR